MGTGRLFLYCAVAFLTFGITLLGSDEKYPLKIDVLDWNVQHEDSKCGGSTCYKYTLWEHVKHHSSDDDFWLTHECVEQEIHEKPQAHGGCGPYIINSNGNPWRARYEGPAQIAVAVNRTRADGSQYQEEIVYAMHRQD